MKAARRRTRGNFEDTKRGDKNAVGIMHLALLLSVVIALQGCSVLEPVISGERRIPLSKFTRDSLRSAYENAALESKIRRVYDPTLMDVYTYVIGFDGTNNSRDCDLTRGIQPDFWDRITGKPSCTTIRRLELDVKKIGFGERQAPVTVKYYEGPGTLMGRITNPLDSATGYTSSYIAERAMNDLWVEIAGLPDGIKEVRLLVVGFSRGAAIGRHFLNIAHQKWSERPSGVAGRSLWSTALLIDTVATGQEDALELDIPSGTEQVVHLIAQNESRADFRPTVDCAIDQAGTNNRLVVATFPGAHSDVGASYRYGAGVFAEFAAQRVLQRMGLLDAISVDYSDLPVFGLVDSRGWKDRLMGTPSGYACGYKRQPAQVRPMTLSTTELQNYRNRLENRAESMTNQFVDIANRVQHSFAFTVTPGDMEWKIVPVENVNVNMGTTATFRKNPEGSGSLLIRDGINKGKDIPLPISVVTEIALRDKAMQLEVAGMVDPTTRTQVEKFWYFVDGCLPEDGTTEGNQSSGSGTVAHDAVENITTCQPSPSEKTK